MVTQKPGVENTCPKEIFNRTDSEKYAAGVP